METGCIKDVSFDEENHKYFYQGKELQGVTTVIGEKLGKNFPRENARVQLVCSYGSQVHKEVEEWINEGIEPSSAKAKWVTSYLEKQWQGAAVYFDSELTVTDYDTTASNIDIVQYNVGTDVILYDIKTGNFDREYCTLQLNAYRVMFEHCFPQYHVKEMKVLCTKTETVFPILKRPNGQSLQLFEKNRK